MEYVIQKKKNLVNGRHTIKDLIYIPFTSSTFLIPSNFEEYLEEKYGTDWKIPKEFSYFDGLDGEYKNLIN